MSEASAHVFLSNVRFRELVDQGVIAKKAAGSYDLEAVRKQYILHLRSHATGHGVGGAGLATERAALAKEQTLAVKFKNAVLRGDYVSLALYEKYADRMILVIRERLLSIPGKSSDSLVMRTRDEIDAILREEIYEALSELSNPASVRRSGDSGEHTANAGEAAPAAEAKPDRMGR